MKQAEHPPATAGASIAAEYSLALIDQLARIDRTCSKEEIDELVYRLLSLIGEAMQSDRVFLFERLEGTAEAYCNTFEWCANGVAPQIDNLTEIVPADMPYWLEVFGRGETIVIPNIEDVKTQMPSEYELLKAQSIRSEIAVPVFYRGNLSGFFGLDNPQRAMTAGQLRLLAFVGGHLGSARENLRMLTLLEEKQTSLEQNLQAVKLEQQMLKVLCKDSTSVYRVDLMNDRAEIVKIEEHSNSAGDLLPHGQELFSYAEAVEHYYHKCVLKESAPDFLQPVALLHHLEHAEAVEAGHVDVEQQQVDVELGVQQIERLHAVVGIEVFVADAEDFGKDLLVHFRIVRDQDFGFDHSVDLIRILGRALL